MMTVNYLSLLVVKMKTIFCSLMVWSGLNCQNEMHHWIIYADE